MEPFYWNVVKSEFFKINICIEQKTAIIREVEMIDRQKLPVRFGEIKFIHVAQ